MFVTNPTPPLAVSRLGDTVRLVTLSFFGVGAVGGGLALMAGPNGEISDSPYQRYPARRLLTTSCLAPSSSPSSASARWARPFSLGDGIGGALTDASWSEVRYSSGSLSRSSLWATATIRRCRRGIWGLGS